MRRDSDERKVYTKMLLILFSVSISKKQRNVFVAIIECMCRGEHLVYMCVQFCLCLCMWGCAGICVRHTYIEILIRDGLI